MIKWKNIKKITAFEILYRWGGGKKQKKHTTDKWLAIIAIKRNSHSALFLFSLWYPTKKSAHF